METRRDRRERHARRRPLRFVARTTVLAVLLGGTAAYAATDTLPVLPAAAAYDADAQLAARELSAASRGAARGTEVVVAVRGEEHVVVTEAATVREVLTTEGVALGDGEVVLGDLDAAVSAGLRIEVATVETTTETVTETVEHGSDEVDDANLAKGTRLVETSGRDGVATTTYLVRSAGGEELGRTAVTTVVESEVRDEVVRVGTMTLPDASAKVLSPNEARALAKSLVAEKGWDASQYTCLDRLWTRESNWRVTAANPHSSAYGIPQSLPGSKMASVGADWRTNARTQIVWGLGYIKGRYGTPCGAWNHSQARGWY